MGFPDVSDGKESACNVGDSGPVPGSENTLEKGMATHSSVLAWKTTGQRSLMGSSPRGCIELDMTEQLSLHFTTYQVLFPG